MVHRPLYRTSEAETGKKKEGKTDPNTAKKNDILSMLDAISTRLTSLDQLDSLVRDFSMVSGEYKEVKENMQTISGEVNRIDSKEESLDKILTEIPDKIQDEVRHQLRDHSYEVEYDMMIGKSFKKYLNLIVDGIAEDPPKVRAQREEKLIGKVSTFCSNILGVSDVVFDMAYRLGNLRPNLKTPRPVLFRLTTQGDREAIWKARSLLQSKENKNYRLREHMPDKLRDDLSILLRVLHHARMSPECYHQPKVYDFRFYFEGRSYFADDLEQLPFPLRPSTITTPNKNNMIIFFTKFSPLSNHFPSHFWVDSISFHSVEQWLAFSRARLKGREDLMDGVMSSNSPVTYKRIMNGL